MTKYIIRRLIGIIPTIFIVITISFFLIRIAPGGPFDAERRPPEQVLENIEAKFNLDQSLPMQYLSYLGDILKGDLGPSFRYQDHDVNYYIANSLPNSLLLGFLSLGLAFIFGVGTGVVSALKQNTWVDYVTMSIAIIGITVPLFVIGPILMYFFALQWNILPTSGWITGRYGMITLIMPVVTLTLRPFATIARLSRASMLEILRSDFIRTAQAKGLRDGVIIRRHVLKGSLLPVVCYIGPAFAAIVTGSVVVEQIFRVPGLGRFFVQSAINRDYTLIMGTVIVYSIILILMNFIVDIVYSFLDPRITYK
ncbi:MAG: ABC transporter permease subunit [Spirochaetia bacterium]